MDTTLMLLTHLVVVVAVVVVMPHSLHRSCYSRYLYYITFIHYYDILYLYYYIYVISRLIVYTLTPAGCV